MTSEWRGDGWVATEGTQGAQLSLEWSFYWLESRDFCRVFMTILSFLQDFLNEKLLSQHDLGLVTKYKSIRKVGLG